MLFTTGILSLIAAALVAIFQPYKVKAHNTIDSVLMILMGIYFVCYCVHVTLLSRPGNHQYYNVAIYLQLLDVATLFLFFILLFLRKHLLALLRKFKLICFNVGQDEEELTRSF